MDQLYDSVLKKLDFKREHIRMSLNYSYTHVLQKKSNTLKAFEDFSRRLRIIASSCPSVRQSCRMSQCGSHRMISMKFNIGNFFENVEKKKSKLFNIGHLTLRPKYILLLPAKFNLHKGFCRVKWHQAVRITVEV